MPRLSKNELLRGLPQVEEAMNHPDVLLAANGLSKTVMTDLVRQAINEARQSILSDTESEDDITGDVIGLITQRVTELARSIKSPSLRRVINASGVIVHTNLGRSPLSEAAQKAVQNVAAAYSTLEYDPVRRARGSRQLHYEKLLCLLTGAESALAVNNNAAAVLLILTEFADGLQAIVSRGELVEIGGSFRIPDIMRVSHARMLEVGTTNKTHLSDYKKALSPETALLLKVHPSNYQMTGFTENVDISALRSLADDYNAQRSKINPDYSPILVYEDLGSGALISLEGIGGKAIEELTVSESLKQGCDLVSFSGDKLLGGPQAGIIVGKRSYINRLKDNPMARALRLDKLTLAALEATLRDYLSKERALSEIPTLRMLSLPKEELHERSVCFVEQLARLLPQGAARLTVVEETARAGGGALPMSDIPSYAVQVSFIKGNAQECGDFLISRREPPIITRIKKDAILCDLRTVLDEDELRELASGFCEYFAALTQDKGEGKGGDKGEEDKP